MRTLVPVPAPVHGEWFQVTEGLPENVQLQLFQIPEVGPPTNGIKGKQKGLGGFTVKMDICQIRVRLWSNPLNPQAEL